LHRYVEAAELKGVARRAEALHRRFNLGSNLGGREDGYGLEWLAASFASVPSSAVSVSGTSPFLFSSQTPYKHIYPGIMWLDLFYPPFMTLGEYMGTERSTC
jgi:hypothetical protein